MKILVVGGGNSAHVAIPMLSAAGHDVSLLTAQVDSWQHDICAEYHTVDGNKVFTIKGKLSRVTASPQEVVPNANLILFCLPVSHIRTKLHIIAPFIPREHCVIIGSIYGQAGFNWMVNEIRNKFDLPNVTYFTYGLIPWIARTLEYGRKGITYGGKARNVVALSAGLNFDELNTQIFKNLGPRWFHRGETLQSPNFISLTLSVDNQIIHPSRCYGLYHQAPNGWESQEAVPFFYRDYDAESAEYLRLLDTDYTNIRKAIVAVNPTKSFPYMLDYLELEHFSYQSRSVSIRDSFVNSKTLVAISTPVERGSDGRWILKRQHRFFSDDTAYGICVAKWFAEQLGMQTSMIDEILRWVELYKGQKFLTSTSGLDYESPDLIKPFASGIPFSYGYKNIREVID